MASDIDDISINYEEDGVMIVKELDRAVLQGGMDDHSVQIPTMGPAEGRVWP